MDEQKVKYISEELCSRVKSPPHFKFHSDRPLGAFRQISVKSYSRVNVNFIFLSPHCKLTSRQ